MNLIVTFLKKANLLEILTILFFISVGISLTYKIGFYSTIGADWYIQNLSPQQLFISSFRVSLASLLGVILGCYLGFKLKYKTVEKITFFSLIFYMAARIYISSTSYGHSVVIDFDIALLILNALTVMFMITIERENKQYNNFNFIGPLNVNLITTTKIDSFFKFLFLMFFLFAPYAIGIDKGNLVNKNESNYSYVKIKNDSSCWLLIDLNGDKVLIKKVSKNEQIFKLVEYKEIQQIISQVSKSR